MKAVRFHQYGESDVLRYEDVDRPAPGPGEVLLRVAATTFNPVDDGIRGGYLQEVFPVALPHTPGIDVAGEVVALGEAVEGLQVGEEVIGFLGMVRDGAAAEYAVVPADALVRAPASVPLADAAALPLVGLTAWQALFEAAGLRAGQRVLVNGAGGAVGGYAVQLAKSAGAHVVATASPASAERVRAAGADQVVDHTAAPVGRAVTEPVDVLLNLARVDAADLTALTELVRPGGIVVNTVVTMPAPADEDRGVRGVNVYLRGDTDQLAALVERVDRGELRVDVAERVALRDLPALHARASSTGVSGKVIVLPA